MVRAVSRESFDELKNYLGVYQQQGRVILDADWNESQDIAVSYVRRLGREALGEGSPNRGFAIDPVFPPPPQLILSTVDTTGLDFEQAIAVILGGASFRGGTGSVRETAIGVLFLAILNNGLSGLQMGDAQFFLIKGAIILAALTLRAVAQMHFSRSAPA